MKLPVRTADGRQTPPPPPPPPSETRPPPKAASFPDDQAWVLKEAVLQLGPALRTAVGGRGRLVVKSAVRGQLLGSAVKKSRYWTLSVKGKRFPPCFRA